MQQGPGNPDYEARMQADIARLNAAKGVQVRAWLRENKGVAIAFGIYLAVVICSMTVALVSGYELGPALICAMVISPFVLLRLAISWARLKNR
jgi:hypothetical protein